ncbi:hypothetical protein IV203_013173 [Nitzschia inconspicua]|uniref:Uncharacterized protein n=1 Tax=Nitzschia inconspicua TaxID=303405 RepID=A0A9K3M4N5_9STRA|nr:hypothetical protein IV203_013173 [Nitzschia inconspicua]
MRFRPLLIDYHAEALHMEEEERRLSGKKRRVIWIQNYDAVATISDNDTNASQDYPFDTRLRDDGPGLDTRSMEQRNNTNETVHSLGNGTNDNQKSVNRYQTPMIKKQYRHGLPKENMEEDNSFVATFKPPRAFLDFMDDNTKIQKISKTASLPFGVLGWEEEEEEDVDLCTDIGTSLTNNKSRSWFDVGRYFEVLYRTPWLLSFVSTIRRQVNTKRITENSSILDPRVLVYGFLKWNPFSAFLRDRSFNKLVFIQFAEICFGRHEKALRIWHEGYGCQPKSTWDDHFVPTTHRALFVSWGLVSIRRSNGSIMHGNFGRMVSEAASLVRPAAVIQDSSDLPSYTCYLKSRSTSNDSPRRFTAENYTDIERGSIEEFQLEKTCEKQQCKPRIHRLRVKPFPDSPDRVAVKSIDDFARGHQQVRKIKDTQMLETGVTGLADNRQVVTSSRVRERISSYPPANVARKFWSHFDEGGTQGSSGPSEGDDEHVSVSSPDYTHKFVRERGPPLQETMVFEDESGPRKSSSSPNDVEVEAINRSKERENLLLERFGLQKEEKASSHAFCHCEDSVAATSRLPKPEETSCGDFNEEDHPNSVIKDSVSRIENITEVCDWTREPTLSRDLLAHDSQGLNYRDQSSTEWFPGPQDDISEHKVADEKKQNIPSILEIHIDHGEKKRRHDKPKESKKKEKKRRKRRKQEKKEKDDLETPRKLDFRKVSPIMSRKENVGDVDVRNRRSRQVESNSALLVDDHSSALGSQVSQQKTIEDARSEKTTSFDDFRESSHKSQHQQQECNNYPHSLGDIPLRMLCSEKFLENFGYVVADLARGDLFDGQLIQIHFIDTPLMKATGVDIELPHKGAFLVFNVSIAQRLGNDFLASITDLAASSRYRWLEVFLCIDFIIDSETSLWITRLQKAMFVVEGFPGTKTRFTITSRDSLSSTIAYSVMSLEFNGPFISENMDVYLSDIRTRNRLDFLLALLPSLSVTGALFWLESVVNVQRPQDTYEQQISIWFNSLFVEKCEEQQRLSSFITSDSILREELGPNVVLQLRFLARVNAARH